MNWYVGQFCHRSACDEKVFFVRLMKHTQYDFVYPFALCYDCANFLQLNDNKVGM
jgi:hypothetical protein